MIVCACVQFLINGTGQVANLCGVRHGDCFSQLAALGYKSGKDYCEICEGFMTNKGEFLDRFAALEYAVKIGQISPTTQETKRVNKERELYSEDLW